MTRIDAHLHVWVQQPETYPWQPTLGNNPPASDAPVELLLETMKTYGIDKAVLVQPSTYGWTNGYLVDCLKRYPVKLAGVCLVDPDDEAAPQQLRTLVREHGIRGLRLNFVDIRAGRSIEAPAEGRIWPVAAELGIPVCLQLWARHLPELRRVVERHPQTTFVIDHMGHVGKVGKMPAAGPEREQAEADLLALADYPNVYVKICDLPSNSYQDYPYPDMLRVARDLVSRFGARRLLWGSNFPGTLRRPGYDKVIDLVTEHLDGVSPEDKAEIMGGTAERLFFSK